MARFAGPYEPGLVQIILGAPVAALGAAVVIPNLPPGATFPLQVTGRAADTFSTAARTSRSFTFTTGADGETVANRSFDLTGMYTLVLQDSSLNNLALSAAHAALTNEIAPIFFTFPLTVIDPASTADIVTGANCVIEGVPDHVRGAAAGTVSWNLLVGVLNIFHGARIF